MIKKTDQQNQDIEDYNRTAGREQTPMVEDDQPVTDEFTPAVLLIIIVISIGFIGVLVWGIAIVFGT